MGKTQKVATKNVELIKDFRKNPDKALPEENTVRILQIHQNYLEGVPLKKTLEDLEKEKQNAIQEIIIKAGR